jgi:hypothetical protein
VSVIVEVAQDNVSYLWKCPCEVLMNVPFDSSSEHVLHFLTGGLLILARVVRAVQYK